MPEPKRPRTLPPTLTAPARTLATYHASRWPGSASSLVARAPPRPPAPAPRPAASAASAAARLPVWPVPSVVAPPSAPAGAVVTPALLASLSNEQRRVLEVVRQGKSVFFTGCAGTGKSYLLKAIVAVLPEQTTHLTALTGVAALNIGGRTLHSFAGIGLVRAVPWHNGALGPLTDKGARGGGGGGWQGKKSKEELLRELSRSSRERWGQCRTLIIDEVSMMSDDLFDKIDHIARCAAAHPLCTHSYTEQSDLSHQPRAPSARGTVWGHPARAHGRLFPAAAGRQG
jgi:energy-coupling factor transporter ATP-binding protein EcfA2